MNTADFTFLTDLLRRRSGLALTPNKIPLVKSRLLPVARRFGFRNVEGLLKDLRYGREPLARAVTEAMTTNESFFFRDPEAFETFEETILPALLRRRAENRRFRIWCAACATGQEAYTLAMILDDHRLAERGWDVEILASDINSDSILRAKEGLYAEFEVQRGLAVRRIAGHFTQEGGGWRIDDALRRAVNFRTFNLLDSYGWIGEVDVIFCRNVLMYFDGETKTVVLDRLAQVLAPDGYLVLGHTETVAGFSTAFVETTPGLYRRTDYPNEARAPLAAAS
ncbi:MAG TPA: protein-glutamate O-methyltransferase CheR [Rhizomicrobium sp.]